MFCSYSFLQPSTVHSHFISLLYASWLAFSVFPQCPLICPAAELPGRLVPRPSWAEQVTPRSTAYIAVCSLSAIPKYFWFGTSLLFHMNLTTFSCQHTVHCPVPGNSSILEYTLIFLISCLYSDYPTYDLLSIEVLPFSSRLKENANTLLNPYEIPCLSS